MTKFKVGDRVTITSGVSAPLLGSQGVIDQLYPHVGGITTMDRLMVRFERREKRAFFGAELALVTKPEPHAK